VGVGIAVDTNVVELGSTAGFELSVGAADRLIACAGVGERWTVTVTPNGALRVSGPDGAAVSATPGPLLARPARGSQIMIAGQPYRGSALVQSPRAGRVTAINLVDLEDYLLGVVPHEIGRVGEDLLEAAKAQAVAARTYAIAHRGRRSALGFDYFATVQDQVYGGSAGEYEVASRAVRETAGEILLYRGVPIEAYYHSTCAGRTAAIEEVWNDQPRPYLVSVVDVNPQTGQAYDHFSSRFRWTQRWSGQQLNQILNRTLADSLPSGVNSVGEVRDIRILERTQSGRVARMRVETSTATFHLGRDRLRWIFLTPEQRILNSSLIQEIELTRGPDGRVTEIAFVGGGWGHGIGMCQVGAMGRARHGQNYRTILSVYYPGTELRRLYRP
jgi:stage II sporulation protein D